MDWKTSRGYYHQEREIQFLFPPHDLHYYQHNPDFIVYTVSEIMKGVGELGGDLLQNIHQHLHSKFQIFDGDSLIISMHP